ncbi:hypothetical protein Trco_007327 [Trichoderma cornu-damae]|uniref:ribonuclease T1 n=1 Tax=Trichoderma cornu-damae TaxID=654480 RepID=A0A9P8QE81_9HYPO|nr:hypothetical protein Trco_007327 [Trichoderma cornu-damae]
MKFFVLLSLVSFASAVPSTELTKRDTATCGKVFYSAGAVGAASSAACSHVRAGSTAGGSTYPHRYNNRERFRFKGLPKPYFEFPILSSGKVYTGGDPGADRVVITGQCSIAGVITHKGASGNGFVACAGTS